MSTSMITPTVSSTTLAKCTEKTSTLKSIKKELKVIYLAIKSDFHIMVVPGVLFAIAAANRTTGEYCEHEDCSTFEYVQYLVQSYFYVVMALIYDTALLLQFCLSNQIAGVDEDKVNKPYRPIPSGLITVQEARTRLYLTTAFISVLGTLLGVNTYSIIWTITTIYYNFYGGDKNGIVKNILASCIGFPAVLLASWQIVSGYVHNDASWWALTLSILLTLMMPSQDLRDVEGDSKIGRRTIVVQFGEWNTRVMLCAIFITAPYMFYKGALEQLLPVYNTILDMLLLLPVVVVPWLLAYRVVTLRNKKDDHWTYHQVGYWFCYVSVIAVAIL